jgi:hypothetical protein
MAPYLIGRAPCGCVVFAALDEPDYARQVADQVARAVRAGLHVERRQRLKKRGYLGPGCPRCLRMPEARKA